MHIFAFSLLISDALLYLASGENDGNDHIASLHVSEEADSRRCHYDLEELWSHEVGHSPFVSRPLIADVHADGRLDVVAAPFSEAVTVLDAESGSVMTNTDWPVHYTDRSFHASPLQFDADGDGRLDVLLTSSDGELFFYTATGQLLDKLSFKIPAVYVRRDWFTQVVTISHVAVHDFILDNPPGPEEKDYISVDPHVLATPTLSDLNNDDRREELVLPVSYYYDTEDYRLVEKLGNLYNISSESLDKYLVSAVVLVNLTSLTILHTVHLDLTQVNSVFPGYLLATPTVADLDSEGGACEIVVATGAGNLHVIESTGTHRKGFPITTNSITNQVVLADILGDGFLELVTVDTSGNVACYDRHGELIWETEVSGPVNSETQLTDVTGDGKVDLVITTEYGSVHVLCGETGREVEGWPVNLGVQPSATTLITSLSQTHSVDMVVLAADGNLYLISSDQKCRRHISIGETSLVQVQAHDLVSESEGLELLIVTNDGTVLCYGRGRHPGVTNAVPDRTDWMDGSDFFYGHNKTGIVIIRSSGVSDISSSSFWLHYHIVGLAPRRGEFKLQVYFGRHLLAKTTHPQPGEYFLSVPSWLVPCHGHVTVVLTNHHGQTFFDSMPVRFYQTAHQDLQWLLCGPFLAMSILVLILHGFPAKDLLPMTVSSKTR